MKALLVVDMQVGLFKPNTPRFDTDGIISRINQLSDFFRNNGDQVIFIQHDGTKEDSLEPDTSDWKLLPNLDQNLNDLYIRKTACDSFYETELQHELDSRRIKKIVITGCATDFCVDTTVRSAASKNFEVVVIKDGHTTTDRPNIEAEKVINHHNWVWENLILPRSQIKVIKSEHFIKELS